MVSTTVLDKIFFVLIAHLGLHYILIFAMHLRLRIVLHLSLLHAIRSLMVLLHHLLLLMLGYLIIAQHVGANVYLLVRIRPLVVVAVGQVLRHTLR